MDRFYHVVPPALTVLAVLCLAVAPEIPALAEASGGDLRLLPENRLRLYMPGKAPKTVLESAKKMLQSLG